MLHELDRAVPLAHARTPRVQPARGRRPAEGEAERRRGRGIPERQQRDLQGLHGRRLRPLVALRSAGEFRLLKLTVASIY